MELIPLSHQQIADQTEPTVDARQLHAFLGVKRDFSNWIRSRIEQYGFVENQDFTFCSPKMASKRRGGHNAQDYFLSLDMAKELAMVERTEKGREARRYFIECERQLQDQERAKLGDAQRRESLPVPAGPREPSRAVRSVMNRLAHAWSVDLYERNRQHLELTVRRWLAEGKSEDQVLGALNHVEVGAGSYVLVERRALFRMTGRITSLEHTFRQVMGDIHALEAQTGLQWYMR